MNKIIFFLKTNVVIISILILGSMFRLYSITNQFEVWDEYTVVRYGENYLNFLRNGDFSKDSWKLNKEHPPFSKYFYGATRIVSLNIPLFKDSLDNEYPVGRKYTFQRIVSAFIGIFSIYLVYLLAKIWFSEKVAWLSALFLALNIYHIAHSRFATQENLVCFLILLTTYFFFRALKSNNLMSKDYLLAAFFWGLSLATKYNAIFFLPLYATLFIIYNNKKLLTNKIYFLKNYAILLPVIGIAVLIAIWPWLWSNPLSQFLESTGSRVGFSRSLKPSTEYFLGVYPHSSPWYYFIVYFIVTTNPIFIIGVILAFLKAFFERVKQFSNNDYLFLLYFLTPFLATFSPLKMDGIRYIFPVYPALSIVSAIGLMYLIDNLSKIASKPRYLNFLTYAVIFITLVFSNITYHPYYMDYYNIIAGGPSNVSNKRLFDFGYWGEGIRDAVNFVNKDAPPNSIVRINFVPTHVMPLLRPDLVNLHTLRPDYIIANPTGNWLNVDKSAKPLDAKDKYEVVYEDFLEDVPMVTVYKRVIK